MFKKLFIISVLLFMVLTGAMAMGKVEKIDLGQCYTTATGFCFPEATVEGYANSLMITVDKGSFKNSYDATYQDMSGLSKTYSIEGADEAQALLRSTVFSLNQQNEKQNIVVMASCSMTSETNLSAIPDYASFTISQHIVNNEPHYYAYIQLSSENDYNKTNSISFSDAFAMAKSLRYLGMTGYLATITSSEENSILDNITMYKGWGGGARVSQANAALIHDTFTDSNGNIIGPEINSSKWYWVCGPEAGMQFNAPNAPCSDSATSFGYSFWQTQTNEPNGIISSANGEYLLMLHHDNAYKWNDITNSGNKLPGLFVEWSGQDKDTYKLMSIENKKHEHSWAFAGSDRDLKAYCTTEDSYCEYHGLKNAISLHMLTNQGYFKTTVLPENATDKVLIWTSENPEIASVNSRSGLISSQSKGTTSITAATTDGSKLYTTGVVTVF